MMTDIQVFVLCMIVFVSISFAYYKGWDDGFELGKQRGWSNGYSSAKATERVVLDEVFDYEKN
jgi:hypothetical protein